MYLCAELYEVGKNLRSVEQAWCVAKLGDPRNFEV